MQEQACCAEMMIGNMGCSHPIFWLFSQLHTVLCCIKGADKADSLSAIRVTSRNLHLQHLGKKHVHSSGGMVGGCHGGSR